MRKHTGRQRSIHSSLFVMVFCSLMINFQGFFFPFCCDGQESLNLDSFAYPLHKGFPVQVSGRLTKSVVVADVDDDHKMEICFSVEGKTYLISNNGKYYGPLWPKDGGYQTPAVADLDDDGQKEIVTVGPGPIMNALYPDGSIVPGWPHEFQYGGPYDTVAIMDLDRNESLEITVASGTNPYFLSILDSHGADLTSFPIEVVDNISYAPGLADLDNDGIYEVIVGHWGWDEERVVAYNITGNLFQGNWLVDMRSLGLGGPRSNITVADIDGDQRPEIMFATDVSPSGGHIHAVVLNHDKTFATGWPKVVHTWIYGGLSVGDLDGDGKLEIAGATTAGSNGSVIYSVVYVWNGEDGTDLPGWPKIVMTRALVGNVIIGDIDGDCDRELLIAGRTDIPKTTYLYAWHHDGSEVADFPLVINDYIVYGSSSCFIADIDDDGLVEIGIGVNNDSGTSRIYVWDLPFPYRKKCPPDWPQYNHDAQHTGNYHFPEGLPIFRPVPSMGRPGLLLLALLMGLAIRRHTAYDAGRRRKTR